jgi:hypothetical protein
MVTRFGYIAPHEHTQGAVGDMYIDKSTGDVYECIDVVTNPTNYGYLSIDGNVSGTTYVWTKKSGGASSWNDLTGKPFYEETKVFEPLNITWDGNTEGLTVVNLEEGTYDDGTSFRFGKYKVSDAVLTDEQIKAATACSINNNELEEFRIEDAWDFMVNEGAINEHFADLGFIIVVKKPTSFFPECGIYFAKGWSSDGNESCVTSFTIPELTISVVHKLDNKYLPDTYLRMAYNTNTDSYKCNFTYDQLYELVSDGLPFLGVLSVSNSDTYLYLNKAEPHADDIPYVYLNFRHPTASGTNRDVYYYADGRIEGGK